MKRLLLIVLFTSGACSSTQINQAIDEASKVLESGAAPTSGEVGAGLKEALVKGISMGSDQVSQTDGYFKNLAIKIPFPPELKKVEQKVRQLGFGKEVDNFVMTMNRGAEDELPRPQYHRRRQNDAGHLSTKERHEESLPIPVPESRLQGHYLHKPCPPRIVPGWDAVNVRGSDFVGVSQLLRE